MAFAVGFLLKMSFLIVGQGNPGPQYAHSKHNVGFRVLDGLGRDYRLRSKALLLALDGGGYAMKPLTYYNLTGEVVAPFARYYKIPLERILVIHDELDLPVGRMRFKVGGSNAGNNGLASITQHLGQPSFHRLRIGVGKPPSSQEGANWVLTGFPPEQAAIMQQVEAAAVQAVRLWIKEGLEVAQQQFNGLDLAKPAAKPLDGV